MGNQKYLFLFQTIREHSFLHQNDRMDTERMVVRPKHSALMFWHKNIVLRFQRFLLTWFIQFLYYLPKTFSTNVLTSKSLIWVQLITLGLFWNQNKIFVWIWTITMSLHFRKPKVPIFLPKWYTALIFAPTGPYRHRKDCS